MKCKKCGEEIEKGTKVCPKCGKKQKSIGKTIVTVLLIIFGINIGFTIFMNVVDSIEYSKMTPEEKIEHDNKKKAAAEEKAKKEAEEELKSIYETDNSSYAYDIIKDYVSSQLKAPKTAKYPSKGEIKIVKNKDIYIIQGFVDSQNSFGAMLRTKYIAEVQQVGKDLGKENFVVKSCNFLE